MNTPPSIWDEPSARRQVVPGKIVVPRVSAAEVLRIAVAALVMATTLCLTIELALSGGRWTVAVPPAIATAVGTWLTRRPMLRPVGIVSLVSGLPLLFVIGVVVGMSMLRSYLYPDGD